MTTSNGKDASPNTTVLGISGMTCSGCASTVARVLTRVPGVTAATVDLSSAKARVAGTADPAELVRAVEVAGYLAQVEAGNGSDR